jgi:hypothetical protein
VLAASIIRVIALMMQSVSTSETSVRQHGAKTQEIAIVILVAVRT